MQVPLRLMHACLAVWIVAVSVAYATGTSPVYGLIGVIIVTTGILVRRLIQKTP